MVQIQSSHEKIRLGMVERGISTEKVSQEPQKHRKPNCDIRVSEAASESPPPPYDHQAHKARERMDVLRKQPPTLAPTLV